MTSQKHATLPAGYEQYTTGETVEIQGTTFYVLDLGRKKRTPKAQKRIIVQK